MPTARTRTLVLILGICLAGVSACSSSSASGGTSSSTRVSSTQSMAQTGGAASPGRGSSGAPASPRTVEPTGALPAAATSLLTACQRLRDAHAAAVASSGLVAVTRPPKVTHSQYFAKPAGGGSAISCGYALATPAALNDPSAPLDGVAAGISLNGSSTGQVLNSLMSDSSTKRGTTATGIKYIVSDNPQDCLAAEACMANAYGY